MLAAIGAALSRERPDAVRELILNELRLRCELGDLIELDALRGRFPTEDTWLAEQYERLKPRFG